MTIQISKTAIGLVEIQGLSYTLQCLDCGILWVVHQNPESLRMPIGWCKCPKEMFHAEFEMMDAERLQFHMN